MCAEACVHLLRAHEFLPEPPPLRSRTRRQPARGPHHEPGRPEPVLRPVPLSWPAAVPVRPDECGLRAVRLSREQPLHRSFLHLLLPERHAAAVAVRCDYVGSAREAQQEGHRVAVGQELQVREPRGALRRLDVGAAAQLAGHPEPHLRERLGRRHHLRQLAVRLPERGSHELDAHRRAAHFPQAVPLRGPLEFTVQLESASWRLLAARQL